MLDYVQIYPETVAMVRRYPAADRALLYEAMVAYGTDGAEPDWPADDLKWFVWEALRQRIDAAAKKSETNRANRRGRNGTNGNEPERNGTNDNEPQRNETNRDPESESESETDDEAECASVAPEDEAHTEEQRQGTRGRARAGWFDPENPSKGDDGAWRYSEQARKAVAQRILSHTAPTLWDQRRYTDAGILGTELFAALDAAMREGIPPGDLVKMAKGCIATWVWEAAVKEAVITQGGTANYPEWTDQLNEIREELQQIRGERLTAAYG